MQYEVENISSVRKKIKITVNADEVNAAIDSTLKAFKKDIQLDGFRKGKAPASVIEKRFSGQILDEARKDLESQHIREIVKELNAHPLDNIEIRDSEKEIAKNHPYTYIIEFEELPNFDIPNYEGLEISQTKAIEDQAEIDKIIEQAREEKAEWREVNDQLLAKDGNRVIIDFDTYENGTLLKDIQAKNIILKLGVNESVPDLENLIKTVEKGKTGVGLVTFPEDFPSSRMAGKTFEMHVTVNSIQEQILPELNENFAKDLSFTTLDEFYDFIKKFYVKQIESHNMEVAQNKLLDRLLTQVSFELPKSMLEGEIQYQLLNMAFSLIQQGYDLPSLDKYMKEYKNEIRSVVEEIVRRQVFLRVIAARENLTVNGKEVIDAIFQIALKNSQDFQTVFQYYKQSGMLKQLKERMLADKAMDLIYSKAKIDYIDPSDSDEKVVKEI